MATITTTTHSARFGFVDDVDKSISITYAGVKQDPGASVLKEVADALIANGAAFEKMPVTLESVAVITTTTETYPVEDLEN